MLGTCATRSIWTGALTVALCTSGVPYAVADSEREVATTAVARAVAGTLSRSPDSQAPTPTARQAIAAASVIAFARLQLGKPYIWGGTGPRGFDCSGLIQKAFATAGIHVPRGSIAQSKAGIRISPSDLLPGDLVFSNGRRHVQLYISNGKVIEAAHAGTPVRVSKMLPTRMINAYVRIPVG